MDVSYNKGDIVFVNLGCPPEIKGHEQGFQRPCVIIKTFSRLGLAIIVPCTTKEPKYGFYTIVKLLKNDGGLKTNSFVLCHQIRTISIDRITKKLKPLNSRSLLKIQSVLIDTLEL